MSVEPSSSPSSSPLREQLLSPGRLRLSLGAAELLDCGRLCELTVDLEARPGESLTHRRGRVRSAVIEVSESALSRVIATQLPAILAQLPAQLPKPDRLAVRFESVDDQPLFLIIGHFASSSGLGLWCSLRVPLGPGRQDFRGPRRSSEPLALGMNLLDGDLRVYGSSPVAPPLLGLSLALAVGSALLTFRHASTESPILPSTESVPGLGMRLLFAHGLREVGADLLWDALLQVLPRHGYRAADPQTAALALLEVHDGTLRLVYEGLAMSVEFDDDPRGRSTVDGGQIESLLLADRLLIEGDIAAALAAYHVVGQVDSMAAAAQLRRAQILSMVPSRRQQVQTLVSSLPPAMASSVGLRLLVLAQRAKQHRAEAVTELLQLVREPGSSLEDRLLLLVWAAELSDDEAQSVSLASEAHDLGSVPDAGPTLTLLADAALTLLQSLSAKLLSDASLDPPPVDRGEPGSSLSLGDRSFVAGELSEAGKHYRRALQDGPLRGADLAHVRLRLAELAHHDGDYAGEERELGHAVEAGAGSAAWSALAALFQSFGDTSRLGVALYAWSMHEVDDARVDLLRRASQYVGPSLLSAIDEALLAVGADDEAVRERVLRRRKQSDDRQGVLSLLIRDMNQSAGTRRRASARLASEIAQRSGDAATEAEALLVALSVAVPTGSAGADDDSTRAVGLLASANLGSVPHQTVQLLRSRLKERGSLRAVLRRLDQRLALLSSAMADPATLLLLLRQSAVCLSLLDETAAAAARWLRAAALGDRTALAETRRLLAVLLSDGQAEQARRLVEAELSRCASEHSAPLRVALGEVLLRTGRATEALGQLELALLRDDTLAATHALLGQVLYRQELPSERERALQHLLTASESVELVPSEVGECALLAARLLLSVDGKDASEVPLLPSAPPAQDVARQVERLLLQASSLLERDPRPLRLLIRHVVGQQQLERALPFADQLFDVATSAEDRASALWQKSQLVSDPSLVSKLLHEALQHHPEHLPSLSSLRMRAEADGDRASALLWLSREIASSPSDGERAELLFKQAELLDPQHQAALAVTTLRKAMQLGSGRAAQRLGDLLFARGELLQAADVAGRAAQLLPRSAQGHQLLIAAEWALRVGDELRAREYLRQASALGDESAQEAEQRLIVLDGGDQPDSRRKTLEARLSVSSSGLSSIETLRQLLLLCARQGDLPSVERYAQALLVQVPLSPLGLTALADCLIAEGRSPDAIFPQLQVSADYPRRATVLLAKAEWLLEKGELPSAIRHFSDALSSCERSDERIALTERLSLLLAQQGDHAAAATVLGQSLLLMTDPAIRLDWQLRMAQHYERAGLLIPSSERLRELLAEHPSEPTALSRLWAVSIALGDVKEARHCLDALVSHSSGTERARWLCRRAELHESQGALSDALSDGEAALSATRDPELLRELLLLGVQLSDGGLIRQATATLQTLRAPLLSASALAGCGLLLHAACPTEQAERLLTSTDEPRQLVAALSQSVTGYHGPLADLDRVLDPVRRVLHWDAAQLRSSLSERAFAGTVDLGAVMLLSRLTESSETPLRELYLSVLAFVEPSGEAAQRLDSPRGESLSGGSLLSRFSPSEARLPQPSDELRPLTTLLGYFARLGLTAQPSVSSEEAGQGPVARVLQRQSLLFQRAGGELVSDVVSLRALLRAARALWLPGHEPDSDAERAWLRLLQTRALQPGLPPMTTEQAQLLLDPVGHALATPDAELVLASARELLSRRAMLVAALEQPDLRPALLALVPSDAHACLLTERRARLKLLQRTSIVTLLVDAQQLLS